MIERQHQRNDAANRDEAVGRFEADHVAGRASVLTDRRIPRSNALSSRWNRASHATRFGYHQIDIKPCSDVDGWIKYMTKRPTKTDYTTSIDWNNTQLGA